MTKCFKLPSLLTREHLGLHLDLDEDLQAAGCFTEVIRGYQMEVVEPDVMHGLQPAGATRVTLDVIIPSPTGLTPEKWKQTATLCPLDWPSNYSLLRLWHVTKDLHQFVDQLRKQMNHRHMFSHWKVSYDKFTSRVLCQLPLTICLQLRCNNMCRIGTSLAGAYVKSHPGVTYQSKM